MTDSTRTIQVDALARVEGEGRFKVKLEGDRVVHSEFSIFEPPRYFEGLLRGRSFRDAPDVTSRICGICPIAYVMGACLAMEDALGWEIPQSIVDLRRLIYCGEWIQSHVLHTHLLHAPDFLGLQDSIELAKSNRSLVESGLSAKKTGNRVMEVIGGRSVHPVNTRVGGFYSPPAVEAIQALLPDLERGEAQSIAALDAFSGFDFPDLEVNYLFVALRHETDYPIAEGRIVSSSGLDIDVAAFPEHFFERQVPHSNALQAVTAEGQPYLVGPLARFNLNADRLPVDLLAMAERAGLVPGCRNPFKSLLARQVETIYAFREAARLARAYVPPEPSFIDAPLLAGIGHGITEAPRGLCYHRYEVAEDGAIVSATIVPPTSQNQRQIELDLVSTVERFHDLDDDDLQWRCEQTIRNYDPCISCATHFLKLDVERT